MPGKYRFFYRFLFLFYFGIGFSGFAFSQEFAEVFGRITDIKNHPLPLVNISISGLPGGTVSAANGSFELKVPANRDIYSCHLFCWLLFRTD